MSKIERYKVLVADDVPHLENDVEQLLKTGWEPVGGPFAVVVVREGMKPREKITISQGMIKRSKV